MYYTLDKSRLGFLINELENDSKFTQLTTSQLGVAFIIVLKFLNRGYFTFEELKDLFPGEGTGQLKNALSYLIYNFGIRVKKTKPNQKKKMA